MDMGQQVCCPWFVCLRGVPYYVGSKHDSESLFQNLVADIAEVQTLRGILLLGGDFNTCTTTLLDTIDTNVLCEMLQAPELAKTKQPSAMAKRQNYNVSVGS
jgi:hypothetical protein